MGIIVNENGVWTGIVTIENLVEQITGEIDHESASGSGEIPLSLADALSPGRIVLDLDASSMKEAIENIVGAIPREELPAASQTIIGARSPSARADDKLSRRRRRRSARAAG